MKIYLLPATGKFYKVNLHAHSTVSDGCLTPAELKALYKSRGYDALAITDHELLVDHTDLSDEDFLLITGFEYAFMEEGVAYPYAKTAEFNCFPRDSHNVKQPCFHPKYVIHGETWRAQTAQYTGELTERPFTAEAMQHFIDQARKEGFLVYLNHPSYSMLDYEMIKRLDGVFGMEIFNAGCFHVGTNEYNFQLYRMLLQDGKQWSPIASDDCHPCDRPGTPGSDACRGFVMVKAGALTHESILGALEKGDFYASSGPLIEELYIEDGKIHLTCSPVSHILMNTKYRHRAARYARDGELITHAVFDLPQGDEYFHFELTDACGEHANTRAYRIK